MLHFSRRQEIESRTVNIALLTTHLNSQHYGCRVILALHIALLRLQYCHFSTSFNNSIIFSGSCPAVLYRIVDHDSWSKCVVHFHFYSLVNCLVLTAWKRSFLKTNKCCLFVRYIGSCFEAVEFHPSQFSSGLIVRSYDQKI